MRFIDPTFYASRRSFSELELMRLGGLMAVVEPITWLGTDRHFAETFLDDFDRLIGPESRRAAQLGLGYAACLGIPAKEANQFAVAQRVLEAMPRFLAHDRVAAIGEIGLDRGTQAEEEVLRRQVRMARQYALPVVIQIPTHERRHLLGLTLNILSEENISPKLVLLNGVTEETLPLVKRFGSWYGLTVDRNTHLSAERAVAVLQQEGLEGVLINSAAGRLQGDPLAVPRTARLMLDAGFTPDEIEQVTYHNPKWFFSQARPLALEETGGIQTQRPESSFQAYGSLLAAGVR